MRVLRILPIAFGLTVAAPGSAPAAILPTAKVLVEVSEGLHGDCRDAVRRSALQMVALASEGRLLPSSLPPAESAALATAFLDGDASAEARGAAVAGLPPADVLVFTGRRLVGGNFLHIDALIGSNRLPVAMDRRLPAFLIPLAPDEAERLRTGAADLGDSGGADAIHGAAARHLVADGLAVRPYAGRMDDLYFHLVQNGTPAGKVEFFAIAGSLPGRSYDPLTGAGSPGATPAARFDLDDVLSGGGFSAVQRFGRRHPGRVVRNPFSAFALKLLPSVVLNLREWVPGDEITLTRDAIRSAIASSRRLSPSPVPPLFQDRSRFLGSRDTRGIFRVANRGDFAGEIADVEGDLVLPEDPEDPVANELLVHSDSSDWLADADPDAIAPDPPDFDAELIAEAADLPEFTDEGETGSFATLPAMEDGDSEEDGMPKPPRPAESPFRVAVLVPTREESQRYLEEIAGSDARLAAMTGELRRIACFRKWLEEAAVSIDGALANGDAGDATMRRLAEAASIARAELAELTARAKQLNRERLVELETRGAMRAALEQRVREERGTLLQRLAGTAA